MEWSGVEWSGGYSKMTLLLGVVPGVVGALVIDVIGVTVTVEGRIEHALVANFTSSMAISP